MRCEICGLVVPDAQGAPSEARNAKETALGLLCGCQGLIAMATSAVDAKTGKRVFTDDQVKALARQDLHRRGAEEYDAKIVLGLQRVAAGKHADDGAAKVIGQRGVTSQAEIDAGKQTAFAMLEDIQNKKAAEAAAAALNAPQITAVEK